MACIFKNYLNTCKDDDANAIEISQQRLLSIKIASEARGDNMESLKVGSIAHRNCLSTYTSPCHIERHLKRKKPECSGRTRPKRKKVSRKPFFWKKQCLFCGDPCEVEKDKKHPDRWRESYECRTADRGKGIDTFKDVILNVN